MERNRIKEIDAEISAMEEKALMQRQRMGGVNASTNNNNLIGKQIRILENRLDKALVKFNEALAHNKQLREEIDNLRRERVVFDNIYRLAFVAVISFISSGFISILVIIYKHLVNCIELDSLR